MAQVDEASHTLAMARRFAVRAGTIIGVFMGTVALGQQEAWEMRVCAPPHDSPVSSREDGGINPEIAQVLADELDANVTFEWTRLSDQHIRDTLMAGDCDVVFGVGEGAGGVLSTIPYARLPYVFVTRADSGIEVASLQDPLLRELRIGTYPSGIPSIALDSQGIQDNVTEYAPVDTPGGGGLDRDRPILNAVIDGDVDVGIVFAPDAARRAAEEDVELRIEPVTPEVVPGPTLIQMSRTWTIGVRPGDEAFRDRLNDALTERWDEVRAVIAGHGVPQADLTPSVAGTVPTGRASIGVIAPSATPGRVPLQAVGEPARRGAELAENVLAQAGFGEAESRVLYANGPTDEATYRAAERMIATENVAALAGGFNDAQAARLAEIAAARGVLFFNVGATSIPLRETCHPTTFHVEASDALLADVAVDWYTKDGVEDWFVVYEDSPAGEALMEHLEASLQSKQASDMVGAVAVEASRMVYLDVIDQVTASDVDAVLLALAPEDQDAFLSQYPSEGAARVALVPRSRAQTREFLQRFREVAPQAGSDVRPATWDASLSDGQAGELNDTYLSRNAEPMNPTAWTTYAAVIVFHHAIEDLEGRTSEALVGYLTESGQAFDLGKEAPLSFRPWDRQLRQRLYLVRPDPEVDWRASPSVRADLAEVVARWPRLEGADNAAFDRFGVQERDSACAD